MFPSGAWYPLDGAQPLEGDRDVEVAAPVDHIPVFVRAGAALPMDDDGELTLHLYAPPDGGTGDPGPLTDEGRALVKALDAHGIIHDTSHLAEESFWELLDRTAGPVMASHSNCRAIVPTDRQLSDDWLGPPGKPGKKIR